MIVKNVLSKISTPAAQFVTRQPPQEGIENFEEEMKVYEEEKKKMLDAIGAKSIEDNVTFQFSLGGIIFDIVNWAAQFKILVPPSSPKLQYQQEKEFSAFAAKADSDGDIEVPDHWIKYLDQVLSDDDLFCKISVFGEVVEEPPTDLRKSVPLRGVVINALPAIRGALLEILPQ